MFKTKHRLVQPKVRVLASRSLRPGRRWSRWAFGIAAFFAISALTISFLSDGRFAVGVDEPALTPGDVARGAAVSTCFTPAQRCKDSIVTRINEAKSEIRVQAFGFTSPPILSALASAKERGLDVAVILDKSNDHSGEKSRYSGATFVARAGIPVFIDYRPAIAHNKIIIIDHHLVVTGSYNFTRSAERRNAENVTFIDSAEVASRFLSNWNARRAVSRAYVDHGQ
jgi:phospholipase D